MALTTYEKGMAQGELQGLRKLLLTQLQEHFGELPSQARERLESWPPEQLIELGRALLRASSLRELGLEDGSEPRREPPTSGQA